MARRIVQAPNRYPSWLAPQARVYLAFDESLSTNLPSRYLDVGPPEARLRYRILPAASYQLKLTSTNWTERGRVKFQFNFKADWPGRTNEFTTAPRGTVVLLHGYGLGDYAMFPWALRLAEDGWRCVLVDLRGHGKSTGSRITCGIQEVSDLSQLLDALGREGELKAPVSALGVSYGAALALRWKTSEPRLGPVVAIAPYAVLSNAVLNICREYAPCLPRALPRAGLKRVPELLGVEPWELDPVSVLARHPVQGLLVAAGQDQVTSGLDMVRLRGVLSPGSKLVVVGEASHETVAYCFDEVVPVVRDWLNGAQAGDDRTPNLK